MNFSKDTFRYFDLAKKNQQKKDWFTKNEELYIEAVKKPMGDLLVRIWQDFGDDLPGIEISPKKITRPLRPQNKVGPDKSVIKTESSFFLAEKPTSRFEWNPGIYFQVGAGKEDNVLGLGLYMVSSRQMKKMRHAIATEYKTFDSLMTNKTLKKYWGELEGDVYSRFPKEYDETEPYAKYLVHKQFFLSQQFTREEITKKNFPDHVIKSLKAALPFLTWTREKVGVYKPNAKFSFRDDDEFD